MEEIDATFAGDSSSAYDGAVAYDLSSTMAADSSASESAGLLFSVLSTMDGVSTESISPALLRQITSAVVANSTFAATADSDLTLLLTAVGNSNFVVDPTRVTIVNFSRGPQVPPTNTPVTIPQIRITPPAPPAATYSVGSPPRNRRQGL